MTCMKTEKQLVQLTFNWLTDYFKILQILWGPCSCDPITTALRATSAAEPRCSGWLLRSSGSSWTVTPPFLPPGGSSSAGSPGMLRCWWNPDWDQISWQKINTRRRPWLSLLTPAPAPARGGGHWGEPPRPLCWPVLGWLTDRGAFYFCTPLYVILHRKRKSALANSS